MTFSVIHFPNYELTKKDCRKLKLLIAPKVKFFHSQGKCQTRSRGGQNIILILT
jgi:hypothetical protein